MNGSMPMRKRAEYLEQFKKDDGIPVFLLNKASGAVGLNLTVASHVLILEPSWNPMWEQQAVSRAHRLGQDRAMEIRRYCVKGAAAARCAAAPGSLW